MFELVSLKTSFSTSSTAAGDSETLTLSTLNSSRSVSCSWSKILNMKGWRISALDVLIHPRQPLEPVVYFLSYNFFEGVVHQTTTNITFQRHSRIGWIWSSFPLFWLTVLIPLFIFRLNWFLIPTLSSTMIRGRPIVTSGNWFISVMIPWWTWFMFEIHHLFTDIWNINIHRFS